MSNPKPRHSFSRASRWQIGLDKVLRTVLVLAVMVMVNYLAAQFFHRFYLSSQTRITLSSRTLTILHSITNEMTVTLYYDTRDADNFYSTLKALADEYHAANGNITVRTVDYERDPGEAEKVKEEYNLPGAADSPNAPPSKDLVIFSCGNHHDYVPGEAIVKYQLQQLPPDEAKPKELQFRKKPVAFNGEIMFTSKLLALAHTEPLRAYFLQGHGESSLSDNTDFGYAKFGLALAQNDLLTTNLELLGDSDVPMDCNLLIIAAPIKALDGSELQKIDRYLAQGGRLLVLFNYQSRNLSTGLEPILQRWGLNVVPGYVKDPQSSIGDQVVVVRNFNPKSFVNPLTQLAVEMVMPRPIFKMDWANPPANPPQVDELAASSEHSTLEGDPAAAPRSYPLIAAVQEKPVAGVTNPRGNTRIVAAGDSVFLDNQVIDAAANRDFVNYAVNWLLDRQELLAGISAQPVTEFRLAITQKQGQHLDWLLLGAFPGGVMVFGWLVWLVRRK
jgi:ABC-2 type transport system permease protein